MASQSNTATMTPTTLSLPTLPTLSKPQPLKSILRTPNSPSSGQTISFGENSMKLFSSTSRLDRSVSFDSDAFKRHIANQKAIEHYYRSTEEDKTDEEIAAEEAELANEPQFFDNLQTLEYPLKRNSALGVSMANLVFDNEYGGLFDEEDEEDDWDHLYAEDLGPPKSQSGTTSPPEQEPETMQQSRAKEVGSIPANSAFESRERPLWYHPDEEAAISLDEDEFTTLLASNLISDIITSNTGFSKYSRYNMEKPENELSPRVLSGRNKCNWDLTPYPSPTSSPSSTPTPSPALLPQIMVTDPEGDDFSLQERDVEITEETLEHIERRIARQARFEMKRTNKRVVLMSLESELERGVREERELRCVGFWEGCKRGDLERWGLEVVGGVGGVFKGREVEIEEEEEEEEGNTDSREFGVVDEEDEEASDEISVGESISMAESSLLLSPPSSPPSPSTSAQTTAPALFPEWFTTSLSGSWADDVEDESENN